MSEYCKCGILAESCNYHKDNSEEITFDDCRAEAVNQAQYDFLITCYSSECSEEDCTPGPIPADIQAIEDDLYNRGLIEYESCDYPNDDYDSHCVMTEYGLATALKFLVEKTTNN